MRTHRFRQGDEMLEVSVERLPDGAWSARIVRSRAGQAGTEERSIRLDASRLADGSWLARVQDGAAASITQARLEREAGDGPGRTVRFGHEHVSLEWIDPFAPTARKDGAGRGGPRKVVSPMPGRVVSVLVAVGEEVAEGQPVVVVEAMKMANELRSPIAGRVKSLSAQPGDKVDAGKALVIVEPAGD